MVLPCASVGVRRMDLVPAKSGLASGARYDAEAESDAFDSAAVAVGVADDALEA